jgi:hypothetical protein
MEALCSTTETIEKMDIFPKMRVTRFEQLNPGDLFLCLGRDENFYALKTAKQANRDESEMVLLGPTFVHGLAESFILPWDTVTVLSLGTEFTIQLSSDPSVWSPTGPSRKPVCLAITDEATYICTNGAEGPHRHLPCYVDMKTGAILERRVPGIPAYTNTWQITVFGPGDLSRTIIKYPLDSTTDPFT